MSEYKFVTFDRETIKNHNEVQDRFVQEWRSDLINQLMYKPNHLGFALTLHGRVLHQHDNIQSYLAVAYNQEDTISIASLDSLDCLIALDNTLSLFRNRDNGVNSPARWQAINMTVDVKGEEIRYALNIDPSSPIPINESVKSDLGPIAIDAALGKAKDEGFEIKRSSFPYVFPGPNDADRIHVGSASKDDKHVITSATDANSRDKALVHAIDNEWPDLLRKAR